MAVAFGGAPEYHVEGERAGFTNAEIAGTSTSNETVARSCDEMKRAAIAAILIVLCIYGRCYGLELIREVKTQDGFTVRLPNDWKPIPRDMLDKYSQAVARLTRDTEKQVYDYGFQKADAPGWFAYPYILIQVRKTGRIAEAQLKSIERFQGDLDKSMARMQQAMSEVVSDARVGEMVYDPEAHILFSQMRMEVKEIGTIRGLIALLLTEQGGIHIAAYAKGDDFSHYLPLFEKIARGVVPDDNLRYQPRMLESVPVVGSIDWGRVLISALIGAALGAAGMFVTRRLRKKKADP